MIAGVKQLAGDRVEVKIFQLVEQGLRRLKAQR
jgi:hypothetical protein